MLVGGVCEVSAGSDVAIEGEPITALKGEGTPWVGGIWEGRMSPYLITQSNLVVLIANACYRAKERNAANEVNQPQKVSFRELKTAKCKQVKSLTGVCQKLCMWPDSY